MTKQARGIRNNNPGNIRNSERNDWKGEVSKADKKDQVFEEFEKMGSKVEFFDPYISSYRFKGKVYNGIEKIDEDVLSSYDLVVITTAHSSVDYDMVARASKVVFDTKNAMKGVKDKSRIEVL